MAGKRVRIECRCSTLPEGPEVVGYKPYMYLSYHPKVKVAINK